MPAYTSAADRFHARYEVADSGCWLWTGSKIKAGYGCLSVRCKNWRAHRFGYELLVGPIPEGLTLDHLCRNRACVNPAHLEPVTMEENVRRGQSPPAQNARKDVCDCGHEFTPENTYRNPQGRRRCITCRREYGRAYHDRHRERRNALRRMARAAA